MYDCYDYSLESSEKDIYMEWDDNYPCDNCGFKDTCDSWEARFCCTLCHYNGAEDCENCDPSEI